MTRYKKNMTQSEYGEPETEETMEPEVQEVPVGPDVPVVPDPAPVEPVAPKEPVGTVVPRKRVRIRPSQKKKLSVAVLCTNPLTRRFI